MGQDARTVLIGSASFDLNTEVLRDSEGRRLPLRAQSTEVLRILVESRGTFLHRNKIMDEVWPDVEVTQDSLVQCIADIRRTLNDDGHNIVQTKPKKGYRVIASEAESADFPSKVETIRPSLFLVLALSSAFLATIGIWGVASSTFERGNNLTIAVFPFEDLTGDERWQRLGRGLAIGISNELARNREFGVIGNETTYDFSSLGLAEAGRRLNAAYVLGGSIQAHDNTLRVSARLLDVEDGKTVWFENWQRSYDDYISIQDDIVARANSSLVAHFWFGALNRAFAERAKGNSAPKLSAYEEYLLGIENILWKKADYGKALAHFERAIEIEPNYARAWAMVGVMKLWIADLSTTGTRENLASESRAAIRKAMLYEPNDAFVVLMMSTVHLGEGNVSAAKRAVFRAVDLSPNNPDILATAAWQSMAVGINGNAPVNWGRKALNLNPKGPPWHKLGVATAMFGAGDFEAAKIALEDSPPHHKRFLYLSATHSILGNHSEAASAANDLKRFFPEYTLSGDFDFPLGSQYRPLIGAAVRAGVPIGDPSKLHYIEDR